MRRYRKWLVPRVLKAKRRYARFPWLATVFSVPLRKEYVMFENPKGHGRGPHRRPVGIDPSRPGDPKALRHQITSEGSDYHFDVVDDFTPTSDEAPPLLENVKGGPWGDTPRDYVLWFNGIWHEGDPSEWGPEVFTPNAGMIDPTGRSTGAHIAASDFLLLFKYFPDLRGEVVSWACNDTEILINWRFVVSDGRTVPVIDKFSFVKGLVSFRMAYFDTIALLSYLAENYGSGPLVDYFADRFKQTETGGGVLFLPRLLWALCKGLFRWSTMPLEAPVGLTAKAGDKQVALRWNPVEGAVSYKVKRSPVAGGPYRWIASNVQGTSYLDSGLTNKTAYYYVVSANSMKVPALPARPAGAVTA